MLATQRLSSLGHTLLRALRLGGQMSRAPYVVIEPPSVILRPFEALVGHIRAREEGRAHTRKPWIWPGSYGEEGLCHLLVGGGGGCETEARDHPTGIDGGEQAEALVPSQAVGPPDVSVADQQPSFASALCVPDRHR